MYFFFFGKLIVFLGYKSTIYKYPIYLNHLFVDILYTKEVRVCLLTINDTCFNYLIDHSYPSVGVLVIRLHSIISIMDYLQSAVKLIPAWLTLDFVITVYKVCAFVTAYCMVQNSVSTTWFIVIPLHYSKLPGNSIIYLICPRFYHFM